MRLFSIDKVFDQFADIGKRRKEEKNSSEQQQQKASQTTAHGEERQINESQNKRKKNFVNWKRNAIDHPKFEHRSWLFHRRAKTPNCYCLLLRANEWRTMPKKWRTLHKTPSMASLCQTITTLLFFYSSLFNLIFVFHSFDSIHWFGLHEHTVVLISKEREIKSRKEYESRVNHAISLDLKIEKPKYPLHYLCIFYWMFRWISDNELNWIGNMKRHCKMAGEIIEIRLLIYWARSDIAIYWIVRQC